MINQLYLKSAFKLIEKRDEYYIIRWNYRPMLDEEGQETDYAYWTEEWIKYKPTLGQVKNIIYDGIDRETDDKILHGFVWEVPGQEEIPEEEREYLNPTLSMETMFNIKAGYDIAVQTNGASLPFTLKTGNNDNPHYHQFTTLEEFTAFYFAGMTYVNRMYDVGWQNKDSINWDAYQDALDELD